MRLTGSVRTTLLVKESSVSIRRSGWLVTIYTASWLTSKYPPISASAATNKIGSAAMNRYVTSRRLRRRQMINPVAWRNTRTTNQRPVPSIPISAKMRSAPLGAKRSNAK